jgi:hypothetical protein
MSAFHPQRTLKKWLSYSTFNVLDVAREFRLCPSFAHRGVAGISFVTANIREHSHLI